jgi:predicted DNA-binding protein with PD1-like motif
MESIACTTKRMIVARFDAGEDLLLSLTACAKEHGIRAGWFSVIGGLKEIAYGLYEQGAYRNIRKVAKHCFELLPTIGNISIKEGEVLIHTHINAGNEEDGRSFGGHLIEGSKIFPFAEVFIHECDAPLGRRHDRPTNLWPLTFDI